MKKELEQILSALKAGGICAPAAIEQANAVRAEALRDFVFNDACDKALEDEGRKIVEAAEQIVRSAKASMA